MIVDMASHGFRLATLSIPYRDNFYVGGSTLNNFDTSNTYVQEPVVLHATGFLSCQSNIKLLAY